jgi:hypothetical protein
MVRVHRPGRVCRVSMFSSGRVCRVQVRVMYYSVLHVGACRLFLVSANVADVAVNLETGSCGSWSVSCVVHASGSGQCMRVHVHTHA